MDVEVDVNTRLFYIDVGDFCQKGVEKSDDGH